MAIIITNDGDKEVGTIAERNAIVNKFDGMQVTVLDTISDIYVGGGAAGYEWSGTKAKWILTWKENKDDLIFVTETHQINNGQATLDHSPQSNLVWNAYIINSNNELLITLDNPSVSFNTVTVGSQNYNNEFLICTYGYGAVQAVIDGISANELLTKLKTVDGAGSGLDADLLDGHDYQEIVTLLATKTDDSSLSSVAKSGSYTDLSNLPTIPSAVSSLTNDSGFQTSAQVSTAIQDIIGAAPDALNTLAEIASQLASDESAVSALTATVAGKVSANSAISAATATKITYDSKGLVTGSSSLLASDVPNLDWGKITSGKPTTVSGFGITDAQLLDADLTAIAGLVGSTGFLKKTAVNTWALDTSTYLTGNQTISVSGDMTGSGSTSIALTLSSLTNSGLGEFKKVAIDSKGRVTGTASVAQSDITGLLGAGSVSNSMLANSSVANLSGTNTGDQTTVSGNAGSATVLQTARTINGVSFNGSSNITVNAVDSTARVASSLIGAANGVCPLDSTSKILSTYLPSYVDDVVEYNTFSVFPSTGETGKIYVDISTNKAYRWSGTVYIYITSGAVDSVAGRTGVVVLTKADVGLSKADDTADLLKPISTATQTALDLKQTKPLIGNMISAEAVLSTLTASQVITTFTAKVLKAVVIVHNTTMSACQTVEMLLMTDGITAYKVEYSEILTASSLGSFSVDYSNGLRLLFSPTTANIKVKVVATIIEV